MNLFLSILLVGPTAFFVQEKVRENEIIKEEKEALKECSVNPGSASVYFEKNLSKIVKKYNEETGNVWKARYVEKKMQIKILNNSGKEEQEGIFLDFNDDNGYAIIGNECKLINFEIKGLSPYLNIVSNGYAYSFSDGYQYFQDGNYVSVKQKNLNDSLLNEVHNSIYKGQTKEGVGNITDPTAYVQDRYGYGYTLKQSKSLPMRTGKYIDQSGLSVYRRYETDNNGIFHAYSEGSCWVVSAYNILQYMADATGSYKIKVDSFKTDYSKPNMYKSSDLIYYYPDTSEPNIYANYYDKSGNNISDVITGKSGITHYEYEKKASSFQFPKLYCELRKYIDRKYLQINDGASLYSTANIINEMGEKFGYDFKAKGTILQGLYGSCGITSIDNNLPFGFSTSAVSNSGYGSHTMAAFGYRIYEKVESWWIFKTTSYVHFYELRDGHSTSATYIDVEALTGFGGIILLDFSIFY